MTVALATPARSRSFTTRRDAAFVGAASMAVAAGAHLAAFPSHRSEGAAVAAFFLIAAGLQAAAAWILERGPGTWSRLAIGAGNVGLLALWVWSRTTGAPFGSHAGTAEPLGALDSIAAAAQVLTLAVIVLGRLGARRGRHLRSRLGLVGVALAVSVSGAALVPAAGHVHDQPAGHGATGPTLHDVHSAGKNETGVPTTGTAHASQSPVETPGLLHQSGHNAAAPHPHP